MSDNPKKLKCLIFYCLKLLLTFVGAPPFGSEKKTVPLPSFTQPLWEGVHGGIHLAIVVASLGEVTGQPVAEFFVGMKKMAANMSGKSMLLVN